MKGKYYKIRTRLVEKATLRESRGEFPIRNKPEARFGADGRSRLIPKPPTEHLSTGNYLSLDLDAAPDDVRSTKGGE